MLMTESKKEGIY